MRTRERVTSTIAVLGSFIGGCGLILLSVFDTKRHSSLHRLFLLIFMLGVAISAIFTIIEYRWLSKDYWGVRELRAMYKAKAIIASILIILAIAFGVTLYTGRDQTTHITTDAGAILEWIISFGFTFYLLTFYFDLRLAKGVPKGQLRPMAQNGYGHS
ncbi:hypothetical protein PQX77_017892 [Marasmius sp. AFHP31]|nr:hypothetical protein PQX77_017892 [Marasmius sp. AFHP31]